MTGSKEKAEQSEGYTKTDHAGSDQFWRNDVGTCASGDTGLTQLGSGSVLVHFVRFDNLHDQHFWSAVRVFGHPDYLHRFWDRRAMREIDQDDIVLFAKGDADQPFHPFTADDEAYQ